MNHDDELRNALERMSATPPVEPGRVDEVHRRAGRIRQRRIALASAMSVLLLAATVGLTLSLLGGSHNARLIEAKPSPSVTDTPTPAAPTTTAPRPRPTPSTTPSAQTSSHGTVVSKAPVIPPRVVDSPTPAQEELHVAVTSHQDPSAPSDYPLTVITLHVTGNVSGDIHDLSVSYDDNMNRLDGGSVHPTCVHDDSMRAVDDTYTFTFYYRNAGSYHVHGIIWTGTCSNHFSDKHDFSDFIDVPVGSTHSNGMTQPDLTLNGSAPSGNYLSLGVTAFDFDGWVNSITVDWGDGGSPVVTSYPNCFDWHGTTWPYGYQRESYTSPALAPGTYHVTVTTSTGGCDGNDLQTATQTWTATVS
ncbi:MAG: hypothetical protein ACJ735_15730 [Actinomycetes bacterium]